MRGPIFDVARTLAETEALHRRAVAEAFAAAGLDRHRDAERYPALLAGVALARVAALAPAAMDSPRPPAP